jgi:uncharacterized protein (DUF924 family)
MTEQLAREVREFWLDPGRLTRSARHSAQLVRERFSPLLERACGGELEAWTASPRRSLSLIIVLDQFSRIIHQGTARAYAADRQALAVTLGGLESGADAALNLIERLYFCLPLQRTESLPLQQDSLALFTRLAAEATPAQRALADSALLTARHCHRTITRFGRFPYRNRVLGRMTTAEEHAWLTHDGRRPAP